MKNIQKSPKKENSKSTKNTYSNPNELVKKEVFGVLITNETEKNILEYIVESIQKSQKNYYIVTPNPEMVVFAQKNRAFLQALNEAKIALCDGMQLYRAAAFVRKPLKERIIGVDFVENLCEKVSDWPITVAFLGAGPGVAEKASECLKAKYPSLKVVFTGEEWPSNRGKSFSQFQKYVQKSFQGPVAPHPAPMASFTSVQSRHSSGDPSHATLESSNQPQPIDILFVAFGAPKQEFWMHEHLNKIPVRVMVGVGGAFDQIVDKSLRPPDWMHKIGLGWLYRLIREPWRIKRQIKLVEFLGLVLKEKFS